MKEIKLSKKATLLDYGGRFMLIKEVNGGVVRIPLNNEEANKMKKAFL